MSDDFTINLNDYVPHKYPTKPVVYKILHPNMTYEMLGFLPQFLNEDDPRSAKEQFNENYAHGGGWDPFPNFTMDSAGNLRYPGDPPTVCLAEGHLREETIRLYEHAWVAIVQKDGSYEVCRMD